MPILLLISCLVALVTPLPISGYCDPDEYGRLLYPTRIDEPRTVAQEYDGLRFDPRPDTCCLLVRYSTGPAKIYCNRDANPPCSEFTIRRRAFADEPRDYCVRIGSFCDWGCDYHGIEFTADGRRLDDTWRNRLDRRLSLFAVVVGLFGLTILAVFPRNRTALVLRVLGLGSAIGFLWSNL